MMGISGILSFPVFGMGSTPVRKTVVIWALPKQQFDIQNTIVTRSNEILGRYSASTGRGCALSLSSASSIIKTLTYLQKTFKTLLGAVQKGVNRNHSFPFDILFTHFKL